MSCLVTDISTKRENTDVTATSLGGVNSISNGVTSPIIANAQMTTKLAGKASVWKQIIDVSGGIICSIRDLVKSAFTRGYWINDRPWLNDQTWRNKP